MDFYKLNFIIQKFFINTKVIKIEMINSGLINKTYIVDHLYNGIKSKFVLQSLGDIFESQEIVNKNHKLITDHIKNKIKINYSKSDNERWKVPCLIKCNSNNLFVLPYCADFWRAMEYINDTISFEVLEDNKMAFETGLGLAKFHVLCSDIDHAKLENTLKDFHNTKHYIDQFNKIIKDENLKKLDDNVNKRVNNLNSKFIFL